MTQSIFQVVDPQSGQTTPGIDLTGMNLQIKQPSFSMQLLPVAPQSPMFCTVVFSANDYKFYSNGVLLGSSEKWPSDPPPLTNPATAYITIGTTYRNNYVMRDIQIFDDVFTANSVLNLYKTSVAQIGDDVSTILQGATDIFMSQKTNQFDIRYVRIQHQNQYLHVQEIEVYDTAGTNVAKSSKVSTSSAPWGVIPETVIDGQISDRQGWPNSNHTYNNGMQYIELDLQSNVDVKTIVVYNRPDCCQDRLIGAKILLYNEDRVQVGEPFVLKIDRKQTFELDSLIHFQL